MKLQAESIFNKCPVCDSRKLTDFKAYRHVFLCRCNSCGFIFSRLKPTLAELEDYYSQYTYGDHYYSSPLTQKRYQELLKSFEPFRKTNRLLDVGCGVGDFLLVAKELGWDCLGIEFSQKAVEVCQKKGLNVLQGSLASVSSQLPVFDVITSFEVIEHINTPREEVALIGHHLRKEGLLFLTTPNFNSLMRRLLGHRYDAIVYPEHLSYFSPSSLLFLLESNGFQKKKIITSGFSFSRFKNSISKTKQSPFTPNSSDEQIRNVLESGRLLRSLKKIADWFFNISGTGLSMKAWFIKKSTP